MKLLGCLCVKNVINFRNVLMCHPEVCPFTNEVVVHAFVDVRLERDVACRVLQVTLGPHVTLRKLFETFYKVYIIYL